MSAISSRFETVARVLPPVPQSSSVGFGERLAALYALAQKSNYVFASPLGPFFDRGHHFHLPRFVYFGPQTHDESLRLAFLTGFESKNLSVSLAVTDLVEGLAADPELGQGLNLSFFPLIDVLGSTSENGRGLSSANWSKSRVPEIDVLEKDARARGYHGFIRIEATAPDDVILVRLRQEKSADAAEPEIDLVSSEDFEPWSIRWESEDSEAKVSDGPLTILDDLPVQPFELSIRLPKKWHDALQREAAASVLRRVISRQRSLQAYRQHL